MFGGLLRSAPDTVEYGVHAVTSERPPRASAETMRRKFTACVCFARRNGSIAMLPMSGLRSRRCHDFQQQYGRFANDDQSARTVPRCDNEIVERGVGIVPREQTDATAREISERNCKMLRVRPRHPLGNPTLRVGWLIGINRQN